MDTYRSIKSPARGEFKDKASKFLAFAFPVENEQEIKEALNQLKEEFWDASHHCYAYMLGSKYSLFRANDAGEPNHSAGDPILSQIRSFKLTDILIVVVRYFGGTKLGVPGLIAAYKSAALAALENAEIIEKIETIEYRIKFDMSTTSIVMKTVKSLNAEVIEQGFNHKTLKSALRIRVRKSLEEVLLSNLKGVPGIEIAADL